MMGISLGYITLALLLVAVLLVLVAEHQRKRAERAEQDIKALSQSVRAAQASMVKSQRE